MSITYSAQTHGKGNLSRGANLIQTLVLHVGVLCEASHLSMEKILANSLNRGRLLDFLEPEFYI